MAERTRRLNVRVTDEEIEKLARLAREVGLSSAGVVRMLIARAEFVVKPLRRTVRR